jgi:beta-xylosidase
MKARLIELQSATVPRKRIFQYLNNMNILKNMKADRNPISNGLSLEINFTKSQISLEY